MKIEVSISITENKGYNTDEIAVAKLEVEAPWDEIKPTAVRNQLESVLDDVSGRVTAQLVRVHKANIAAEREQAAELAESF